MKNIKINVAELLKDCPRGMELNCTMYENVQLDYIALGAMAYPIKIQTPDGQIGLNKYGCYSTTEGSKCVIFPKGKNTWEGFQRPFKDGDVISNGYSIAIFYKLGTPNHCVSPDVLYYHCYYKEKYCKFKAKLDFGIGTSTEFRYATEEEKQKLFQAIKDNGYRWNAETKTLEKLLKFKVGDRIKYRGGEIVYRIVKITEDSYVLDNLCSISISIEHMYDLVPNKFDISTLKPFDRVLVRCSDGGYWQPQFFSKFRSKSEFPFVCTYNSWRQCIPYEGNEHLSDTTNDCDEFYKTW